ncbi:MAG: nicotinate-nucleotide--dimethylbenzimidazole phosphoribosyltransferase [Bacteroidales bacterium]|nr:nicotinate-nucleotide--dimethylbenzimidazole phosphoribosyltransferase [Bacteroidales bacterium]
MNTLSKALQSKIDNKTKPLGALGLLEELAFKIGMIQETESPQILRPSMLVFAADHGITDEKISPYPKEVTWQMVMNFVSGGAAINVFCRQHDISLKVVDAGVDFDFPATASIISAKLARGTKNMLLEPAMDVQLCQAALDKGAELVTNEAQSGTNTIAFGEMGIGNTSASALLMHRFMNLPIEDCIGVGAGLQSDALKHKHEVLKKVSQKYNPKTALETLATFGGLEIAMMTGAIIEAYRNKMLILIDGFIATAALLAAEAFNPNIKNNCVFCHMSNEQGHQKMLKHFDAKPILQLGLRLGEGTGAALAMPIIKSACAFLNEMASFADAGVSNKD